MLRTHEDAWKAAIGVAVNADVLTYDERMTGGEAVRITVTRAARETPWACGVRGALCFRLTTECVSTTRDNVQDMRVSLWSLQDRPLPSIKATLLVPDGEADEPTQDDDLLWSAFDSWIYYAPM